MEEPEELFELEDDECSDATLTAPCGGGGGGGGGAPAAVLNLVGGGPAGGRGSALSRPFCCGGC